MERDESWLPPTRSASKAAARVDSKHEGMNLTEYLEDSPIYTLVMLLLQQFAGLTAYFGEQAWRMESLCLG